MLTLAEAATQVGRSKPTRQRAIKAGRMSATRDEHGAYRIDPAELARAYPNDPPPSALAMLLEQPTHAEVVADLARQVATLEARLAMAIDERDYLRERIIAFERTANQTLSLLKDGRTRPEPEPDGLWPDLPRRRPGMWRRLFG